MKWMWLMMEKGDAVDCNMDTTYTVQRPSVWWVHRAGANIYCVYYYYKYERNNKSSHLKIILNEYAPFSTIFLEFKCI